MSSLSDQVEDWRLVSMPHPDYALMLWCGRLPVLDYSGGIVISRQRKISEYFKKKADSDPDPNGSESEFDFRVDHWFYRKLSYTQNSHKVKKTSARIFLLKLIVINFKIKIISFLSFRFLSQILKPDLV